ncbi:unnamed protein product [Colias eurytheme]|nr:unnamed protein product [Colias eurytheme]
MECTVDGRSYMDPLDMRPLENKLRPGEDPCNPLYWYPRNIPEYCNYKVTNKPMIKPPLPMPLPVPIPMVPPPPPIPIPVPPMPAPYPIYPVPPLPYGIPIAPTNPMIPVIQNPYIPSMYPMPGFPSPAQAGMVPGLPGMVSRDGGINILPFSDVYADMLEKHRNKMIRRKLARIIGEYEDFPNRKTYNRLKKFREMY